MARVVGFMYADSIQPVMSANGVVQQIHAPMVRIGLQVLPTEKSFSVAYCVDDYETSKPHQMGIKLFNPDNEVVFDAGEMTVPASAANEGLTACLDIRNLLIKKEGFFSTCVIFDGVEIGRYPIRVFLKDHP